MAGDKAVDDSEWLTEHRYRAVRQVLDGVPVAEVARQVGASRQSAYAWKARYEAEVEAQICELRRAYRPGQRAGAGGRGGCRAGG